MPSMHFSDKYGVSLHRTSIPNHVNDYLQMEGDQHGATD